ncbi:cell division protein SepF [Corynebacterium sp. A21]|uniref:cell division protein SepF n=1 Tax=Corynebacterium sp. A21 TaxID=3457318 RepID=UPI003FD3F107
MSIMKSAKEFFGLTPIDMEQDDAYYSEGGRYGETQGSAAYAHAPRQDYEDYPPAPAPEPASYAATIVPVELRSYKEAARIGEPFRDGDVVVFDLSDMDKAEATRLVDFAAGLCFALRGTMKKVEGRVFAIVPETANVSQRELERAARLR